MPPGVWIIHKDGWWLDWFSDYSELVFGPVSRRKTCGQGGVSSTILNVPQIAVFYITKAWASSGCIGL